MVWTSRINVNEAVSCHMHCSGLVLQRLVVSASQKYGSGKFSDKIRINNKIDLTRRTSLHCLETLQLTRPRKGGPGRGVCRRTVERDVACVRQCQWGQSLTKFGTTCNSGLVS